MIAEGEVFCGKTGGYEVKEGHGSRHFDIFKDLSQTLLSIIPVVDRDALGDLTRIVAILFCKDSTYRYKLVAGVLEVVARSVLDTNLRARDNVDGIWLEIDSFHQF